MADIFLPEVDSSEEQDYIYGVFVNPLAHHGERDSSNESSPTQPEAEIITKENENERLNTTKGSEENLKGAELRSNEKEIKDIELNDDENANTDSEVHEDPKSTKDSASRRVKKIWVFELYPDKKDGNGEYQSSEDAEVRVFETDEDILYNAEPVGGKNNNEDIESNKDERDSKDHEKDDSNEGASNDSNMEVEDMFNFPPPSVSQLLSDLEGLADSEFIHHRQLAVKKILDCLRKAGSNQEHLQSVISVMCRLSEDEESMVRSELVQHIPSIALFCQGHSTDLKRVIRQQLVPYTVKLLNDSQIGVRKLGQSALLVLLEDGLIDQSQLSEWICPLVSQLTICESNLEELRIEDVTVMSRMIPFVGRDITVKFFLEPYISLCSDPAFGIRKICATSFGVLCRIVGTETTESTLLRVFHDLCYDEVCGVRKACADAFVEVASTVSLKTKKEVLPHLYINLLNDYSRFVKYAAYQSLGGFICTFADPSKTGLTLVQGCLMEHAVSLEPQSVENLEKPKSSADSLVPELSGTNNCERLCNGEVDIEVPYKEMYTHASQLQTDEVCGQYKEMHKPASRPRTDSIAVTAKDEHVFLHIDNENVFNTFQFWRTPLPEVELDIDIDGGKATNIHIRAKMPGGDGIPARTSEIKVRIAPKDVSDLSESVFKSSSGDSKLSKLQVQTACINTITPLADQPNQLQIETEISNSSYEEAVCTFKDYSLLGVETKKLGIMDPLNTLAMNDTSHNFTSWDNTIKEQQEESPQMTPYDQDIVPPELLSWFISLASQHFPVRDINKKCDEERIGYCAYSFPAVAFTLGRRNWPCIQSMCKKLAKDTKWTIRETIASSLHVLAIILGHDLTAKDLLPIFLDLLKDVDEVRMKLIMHLFEFLQQLQPTWRRTFLPLVEEFGKVDNERNWRFRCTVAEQLRTIVELFDSFEILKYFLPIALGYVQDKVSAVRIAAVELVAVIIRHLMRDESTKCHVKSLLDEFDVKHRQANKWIWRQTYILLCEQLAVHRSLPMDMYAEIIVPKLFTLAWDNVPNVRMAVSRCIANTLMPYDYLPIIQKLNYEQLLQVMYNLQGDVDEDVRHFARLSARAFSVLPEKKLSPV